MVKVLGLPRVRSRAPRSRSCSPANCISSLPLTLLPLTPLPLSRSPALPLPFSLFPSPPSPSRNLREQGGVWLAHFHLRRHGDPVRARRRHHPSAHPRHPRALLADLDAERCERDDGPVRAGQLVAVADAGRSLRPSGVHVAAPGLHLRPPPAGDRALLGGPRRPLRPTATVGAAPAGRGGGDRRGGGGRAAELLVSLQRVHLATPGIRGGGRGGAPICRCRRCVHSLRALVACTGCLMHWLYALVAS